MFKNLKLFKKILYFANNSTTNSSFLLENYKVCTSGEDKHCINSTK